MKKVCPWSESATCQITKALVLVTFLHLTDLIIMGLYYPQGVINIPCQGHIPVLQGHESHNAQHGCLRTKIQ